VRKKLVEREEEERRKSRKIKDINRMEEQEKELLLQIYACKMVDVNVDTEDIKNNQEKGTATHQRCRHIISMFIFLCHAPTALAACLPRPSPSLPYLR